MCIGRRIETAMIKSGRKPVDIARRLKISESAVSQWFSKDTGPKSIRLAELAAFLNTSVEYLITEPQGPAALGQPHSSPPLLPGGRERPDLAVYASAAGRPWGPRGGVGRPLR